MTLAGRYRLERRLGKGGMGEIYEAQDTQLERRVAVKLLAEAGAEQDAVAEMLREARLAARLDHPHAVRVLDYGENPADGRPYIVQELLEGQDLRSLLKDRSKLSLRESFSILVPVMAALSAAHRKGIVHRDVKPENIFLAQSSNAELIPKLIDFGIARDAGLNPTQRSVRLGTPRYMSPEQITGSAIDARTDIWAMGVVLCETLSGQIPFPARNEHALMLKITSAEPPLLPSLPPGTPPTLGECILRSLAKRPDDRIQSMDEFLETLLSCNGVASEPWCVALGARHNVAPKVARVGSRPRQGGPFRRVAWVGTVVIVALSMAGYSSATRGRHSVVHVARRPEQHSGVGTRESTVAAPTHCPEGMVSIPAGEFLMGAAPGSEGLPEERPQHLVRLSTYCLDLTEVTVAQYAPCVQTGSCRASATQLSTFDSLDLTFFSRYCNWTSPDHLNHPMNCVDWMQADAFCRWAGKRLPTEAEWEYGARGSDGRIYPWGNELPTERLLNAWGGGDWRHWSAIGKADSHSRLMYEGDDGWPSTAPVGQYPAGRSPFGLYDMAGNVWEWAADSYDAYGAPHGNTALQDPIRRNGQHKVARGGSLGDEVPGRVRTTRRLDIEPQNRLVNVGFRCAWSATRPREVTPQ